MPMPSIPTRGAVLTASSSPRSVRMGRLVRQSLAAMTPAERSRVAAMYGVIAGLHVLGFVIVFVFVVPSHYKGLGIGVAVLAYTLGLRHRRLRSSSACSWPPGSPPCSSGATPTSRKNGAPACNPADPTGRPASPPSH